MIKKNKGEGAWEMSGSVHEGDRQAMMRENNISKEVIVEWIATAKVRENRERKTKRPQETNKG